MLYIVQLGYPNVKTGKPFIIKPFCGAPKATILELFFPNLCQPCHKPVSRSMPLQCGFDPRRDFLVSSC